MGIVAGGRADRAAAQNNTQPVPASVGEQAIFDAVMARLATNTALTPIKVTGASGSFSNTLKITLVCPKNSVVTNVAININTSLVHWDPRLANPGTSGTTFWNPQTAVTNNSKTVTCQNWMMFDTNVFGAGTNAADAAADEGLLYHELLHLQLLINNMTNATAWLTQVCNCTFTLNTEQADHVVILPIQDNYVSNRVAAASFLTINALAQRAGTNGAIDIDLGPASDAKTSFTTEFLEPLDGSNVDFDPQSAVAVNPSDGHYHFQGTLHDPTKPGHLWVRIDPLAFVLFAGVEYGLIALPESPPAIVSVLGNDQLGRFRFAVYGEINDIYAIEVSSNLLQWVSLGTITNYNGVAVFTDTNSPNLIRRFYHAQIQ